MPRKPSVTVSSNNPLLVKLFTGLKDHFDLKFERSSSSSYHLIVIDLHSDLTNISQEIINAVAHAKQHKAKLIVALLFAEKVDIEKTNHFRQLLASLEKDQPNYRIVLIKDLYQDVLKKPVTYLDQILEIAVEKNSWQTSIRGRSQYFPLYIGDLIDALTKIFFLNNTAGKTFWLLGDQLSDLDIGYLLKKTVADDRPDFEIESVLPVNAIDQQYVSAARDTQISLNWRPDTDFSIKIPDLIRSDQSAEPINVTSAGHNKLMRLHLFLDRLFSSKRPKEITRSVKSSLISVFIRIILLALALYIADAVVFSWLLFNQYRSLNKALDFIGQGDLENSVQEINRVDTLNYYATQTFQPLQPLLQMVSPDNAKRLNNLFNFNDYLTGSLQNLQQTYNLANKIYSSITDSQSSLDPSESALALQSNLSLVYNNLRQIKITVDNQELPGSIVNKIKKSQQFSHLDDLQNQVDQAMKISELLPAVLGDKGTSEVGVLIQDQDELRPTGGLIDELLILKFDHGKLTDVRSLQPTDVEIAAIGTVPAPEMLSRVTGDTRYKFRDMNYPADYSQTGQYIVWYLGNTIDLKLNALIAVNRSFFTDLLTQDKSIQVGEQQIKPQDFTSTIDASSPADPVVNYYVNRFRSGKLSMTEFGHTFLSELEKGNILLYSADNSAQDLISRLPVSGTVLDHFCHPGLENYTQCISQTTYINESNFSFAPVNTYLKRSLVHHITIGQNSIDHRYQLDYTVNSDLTHLGRPYQTIYQLFAPKGAKITQITLDSQPATPDVIELDRGNFSYFQIPLSFPLKGKHKVVIGFTVATAPIDIKNTAFSFTEIRQPGLTDNGTLLTIDIPANTRPVIVSQPITSLQGALGVQLPTKTATFGLGLSY